MICSSHTYRLGKRIGRGGDGVIYKGCIRDNCEQFVVKIVPRHSESDESYSISRLAQIIGVGPQIVERFECDGNVYTVMEKLDGPIQDVWNNEMKKSVSALISRLINFGIFHNDLHTNNIMYKRMRDGSIRLYIIDYDRSYLMGNMGYERFDRKVAENMVMLGREGIPTFPLDLKITNRPKVRETETDRVIKRIEEEALRKANIVRRQMRERMLRLKARRKETEESKSD